MNLIRLIPPETRISFMKARFVALIFSALLLLGSIALFATKGLNFGIDFTGGTLVEVRIDQDPPPEISVLREKLNRLDIGTVQIQEFGRPDDFLIRLQQQKDGPEAQERAVDKVRATLRNAAEGPVQERRVEFVGPQVGKELVVAGAMAVGFALLGILAYVWFRFEAPYALAAIVALVHDGVATVGLFSLTGMEFNLATVAAVLTIAGYSINDTVVVFDRVRENARKYKKTPLIDILNQSLNQTLSRTVMTSVTTLLALFALWGFGGAVLRDFISALVFGVVIGTYSSVFVAAPALLWLRKVWGGGNAPSENPQEEQNAPAAS